MSMAVYTVPDALVEHMIKNHISDASTLDTQGASKAQVAWEDTEQSLWCNIVVGILYVK